MYEGEGEGKVLNVFFFIEEGNFYFLMYYELLILDDKKLGVCINYVL